MAISAEDLQQIEEHLRPRLQTQVADVEPLKTDLTVLKASLATSKAWALILFAALALANGLSLPRRAAQASMKPRVTPPSPCWLPPMLLIGKTASSRWRFISV